MMSWIPVKCPCKFNTKQQVSVKKCLKWQPFISLIYKTSISIMKQGLSDCNNY